MRFSLRSMFVLLAALAAGLTAWTTLSATAIVETGSQFDVAIVGRGYFQLRHPDTDERGFTRNGRFRLGLCGQLCIRNRGVDWQLDPPIQIPLDYARLIVADDGTVQYSQRGSAGCDAGTIVLALFACPDELASDGGQLKATELSGAPVVDSPARGGVGCLQQGWIEQRMVSLRRLTACGAFVGAIVVASCWTEITRLRRSLTHLTDAQQVHRSGTPCGAHALQTSVVSAPERMHAT